MNSRACLLDTIDDLPSGHSSPLFFYYFMNAVFTCEFFTVLRLQLIRTDLRGVKLDLGFREGLQTDYAQIWQRRDGNEIDGKAESAENNVCAA